MGKGWEQTRCRDHYVPTLPLNEDIHISHLG